MGKLSLWFSVPQISLVSTNGLPQFDHHPSQHHFLEYLTVSSSQDQWCLQKPSMWVAMTKCTCAVQTTGNFYVWLAGFHFRGWGSSEEAPPTSIDAQLPPWLVPIFACDINSLAYFGSSYACVHWHEGPETLNDEQLDATVLHWKT